MKAYFGNFLAIASASTAPPARNAFQIATSSRQVSMTQGQQLEPQHAWASAVVFVTQEEGADARNRARGTGLSKPHR